MGTVPRGHRYNVAIRNVAEAIAIGTKAAAKRKGQVGQCAASPCPLPGQPRRAENSVLNTG